MRILSIVLILFVLASCSRGTKRNSLDKENLVDKVKSVKEYWLEKDEAQAGITKKLANENHFNDMGYVIKTVEFGEKDSVVKTTVCNYDDNYNIISKQAFSGDKNLIWRLEYSYNIKDSMVSVKLLIDKGTVLNTTNYRFTGNEILNPIKENKFQFGDNYYDAEGNLVEIKYSDKSSIIKYNYTESLLTEALYLDTNNKLIYKETYMYDGNKNPTEKRKVNSLGKLKEIQKFAYKYDDKGNWIKRQEYYNNKKADAVERVIEYY
jgi:hypothetical protein